MIYDPEANILSIELAQGQISHVREVGNILIHVSKAEKPILIEILDASKFTGQIEKIQDLKEARQILPAN